MPPIEASMARGPVAAYRWLSRLGRRPWRVTLAIGLFVVAFRLALSGVLAHPVPEAADEFAYLLGADLFAHGQVAGQTHPLWKFFESVHVLWQPAYAPKYPPAQAAFLAIGQVVFGDPFAGVLLSVALFAAAAHWMLTAYVRPAWALLGGVATALYFGAGHYWTETYWGGAVAGFGAALVIGAFGRRDRPWLHGALFGLGALLLMTSRPFEGCGLILVLVLTVLVRREWRRMIPLALSLLVGAAIVLAYNSAITGVPWKMPYMVHIEQYSANPPFWWMAPFPEKHYENESLRAAFRGFELKAYESLQEYSPLGRVRENALTVLFTVIFDGGIGWLAALVFAPLLWRKREARFWMAIAGLLLAALLIETFLFLHYLPPLMMVGLVLAAWTLEELWRRKQIALQQRIAMVTLLGCGLIAGGVWRAGHAIAGERGQMYRGDGFGVRRAAIAKQILDVPGSHVVLVRFMPRQSIWFSWVVNEARVDNSRLIWAHDRGPENPQLAARYPGRTWWMLEEKGGQIQLVRTGAPSP